MLLVQQFTLLSTIYFKMKLQFHVTGCYYSDNKHLKQDFSACKYKETQQKYFKHK